MKRWLCLGLTGWAVKQPSGEWAEGRRETRVVEVHSAEDLQRQAAEAAKTGIVDFMFVTSAVQPPTFMPLPLSEANDETIPASMFEDYFAGIGEGR